jgi:C4-dicarboxylate transporter, DctM subunit
MRTTAMIMAILLAAYFLNLVIGIIGLTASLTGLLEDLGLTPNQTLLLVIAFYVVLGCFMETLSMMVATIPIITPVMIALGFDPVWFGIMIILLIEMAMITPPVGINLFVVQGLRRGGDIKDVIIGAAPFVLMLFLMIALLTAFPDIALYLPRVVG